MKLRRLICWLMRWEATPAEHEWPPGPDGGAGAWIWCSEFFLDSITIWSDPVQLRAQLGADGTWSLWVRRLAGHNPEAIYNQVMETGEPHS